MPKWIHDRAEHLLAKNPDMSKGQAFAIATEQSHAGGHTPKSYGTKGARREAKAKYDTPKNDEQTANPGKLDTPKMSSLRKYAQRAMSKKARSAATIGGVTNAAHAFAALPATQRAQTAVLGRMGTPQLGELGLNTANQLAHMEAAATRTPLKDTLNRLTPDMKLSPHEIPAPNRLLNDIPGRPHLKPLDLDMKSIQHDLAADPKMIARANASQLAMKRQKDMNTSIVSRLGQPKVAHAFTAHYDATTMKFLGRTTKDEELANLLSGSFGFPKNAGEKTTMKTAAFDWAQDTDNRFSSVGEKRYEAQNTVNQLKEYVSDAAKERDQEKAQFAQLFNTSSSKYLTRRKTLADSLNDLLK